MGRYVSTESSKGGNEEANEQRPKSMSPEEHALSYIESRGELTDAEAGRLFDALKPLPSREFLVGSWDGGCFETGHPGCKALIETKWAGKDFRGVDDVDPIMTFDDKGGRFWNEEWGNASVSRSWMFFLPFLLFSWRDSEHQYKASIVVYVENVGCPPWQLREWSVFLRVESTMLTVTGVRHHM